MSATMYKHGIERLALAQPLVSFAGGASRCQGADRRDPGPPG
jgi:hypothetical protein